MSDETWALDELLFDWVPLPALIHDASVIVDVNLEAMKRLGATSADQLVGRSIHDIVHPDAREAGDARRRMLAGGHRFIGVTTTLMKVDGSEIDATGGAIPFCVGDSDLAVAVVMDLDCPASVFGDAPLEMPAFPNGFSARAAALQVLPAPVVALRGLTITYANPATAALMSASSEDEIVGRSILELVHGDMREALAERLSLGFMSASLEMAAPGKIQAFDGSAMNIRAKGQLIEDGEDALRVWSIIASSPREFPEGSLPKAD